MPVTASGLWDRVISFENLYAAYIEARRGKRERTAVMHFTANVEENLINLHNHLVWKSWRPGKPREFVVKEPKLRLIQAPPFTDRVIHHALVQVVEPLFERKFIYDSYACRRGKGTQAAVARVQYFLRVARRNWGDGCYVLQADISRFFASIKHSILMEQISRTIRDPDILWLWQTIVSGYGCDGVGQPVGALTSQLGANLMMNHLDHVAKDDMGLKYFVRYMDDFVVILPNKAEAARVMQALTETANSLGLSMNPKTAIHPWQRGVDFCGYRIWPTHILPRKRNIKRARKSFKRLSARYARGDVDIYHVRQRVSSFLAYSKHCQAQKTVEGVLGDLRLQRNSDL